MPSEKMEMSDSPQGPESSSRQGRCLSPTAVIAIVVVVIIVGAGIGAAVYFLGFAGSQSNTELDSQNREYRLPTSLLPQHYDLRLQPDIYGPDPKTFSIKGSVVIHLRCLRATDVIVLHVDGPSVDVNALDVVSKTSGAPVKVKDTSVDKKYQFYKIHLGQSLASGEDYTVHINKFTGKLDALTTGMTVSSYQDNGKTVYVASSTFHPVSARQVFPCLDEPGLRATFNVSVARRTDKGRRYTALSNMPLRTSIPGSNGWQTDVFKTTPKLSPSMVAVAVSDCRVWFQLTTATGVEIRFFVRPNYVGDASVTKQDVQRLFDWFDLNLQPPYDKYMTKLDILMTPSNENPDVLSENWGLLISSEDPQDLLGGRYGTCLRIARSLATLWFGNLVTPSWWDDIWLRDAITAYISRYAMDQVFPQWKAATESLQTDYELSSMEAGGTSLQRHLKQPETIKTFWNSDISHKAEGVLKMLHFIMGKQFMPALNAYLKENAFGSTDEEDLYKVLDEFYPNIRDLDVSISQWMDQWITKKAYPIVEVSYEEGRPGTIRLAIYDEFGNLTSTPSAVPVTYTTSEDRDFDKTPADIVWLQSSKSVSLPAPSTPGWWVLVNPDRSGYYRVKYDKHTLDRLTAQIRNDRQSIPMSSRATLISDHCSFSVESLVTLPHLMELLDGETDIVVWVEIVKAFAKMDDMLTWTALRPDFMSVAQYVFDKPLKMVGFESKPGVKITDGVFRNLIVNDGCSVGCKSCVNQATRWVKDWMTSGDNRVPVLLRGSFYCATVRAGGDDVWDFLFTALGRERDDGERISLFYGLACINSTAKATRLLEFFYDDRELFFQCCFLLMTDSFVQDTVFDFVLQHLDELISRGDEYLIKYMLEGVPSRSYLDKVKAALESVGGKAALQLHDTVKSIDLGKETWLTENSDNLKQWISDIRGRKQQ